VRWDRGWWCWQGTRKRLKKHTSLRRLRRRHGQRLRTTMTRQRHSQDYEDDDDCYDDTFNDYKQLWQDNDSHITTTTITTWSTTTNNYMYNRTTTVTLRRLRRHCQRLQTTMTRRRHSQDYADDDDNYDDTVNDYEQLPQQEVIVTNHITIYTVSHKNVTLFSTVTLTCLERLV